MFSIFPSEFWVSIIPTYVAECDWAKGENASKFAIYIETEKNE